MRRGARVLVAALSVAMIAACSEGPNTSIAAPKQATLVITPSGNLDQSVLQVLSLYPKGLETAATTRWGNIKSKYAAGLSDPSQMVVAKQMLADLTDWIVKKTPDMAAPPNNETKSAASARAALYMSLYVYNGPTTQPPSYAPASDAVVGLVTPAAPATIVTPTKRAGIELEAGSVAENTIIVVTQNPAIYPDNCSGPLQTRLCQYPQFYTFEEFPHKTLLKPAKFNVCHINSGDQRRPLADHDRFRLAHAKPQDPSDYTPGSTIRDQNGESIEILPLIAQTFSTCVDNAYSVEVVGSAPVRLLTRVASGLKNFFAPKTAYAIDLGLGGLSRSMSPFNDVDPMGTPDALAESISIDKAAIVPGQPLTIGYTVRNTGTASQGSVPAAIVLHYASGNSDEVPPADLTIGSVTISSLVPGAINSGFTAATIPEDVQLGPYSVRLEVGADNALPDVNLANNATATPLTVAEIWHVQESGGWHATWTRLESGGAFAGAWTSDDFTGHTTALMSYARSGGQVDFQRVSSSDGRLCHYSGTLAADRLSASGTETCPGIDGSFSWTATIVAADPVIQ